jgi:Zn-finger nucleic acid-binding protein
MELIEFEGVEVDRCKNCKGTFFDAGEFTDLSV